jgi:2-polyprenyl-3-methyl-5-hydroxy-6-metoxy-1,4-benzoquinol methylase
MDPRLAFQQRLSIDAAKKHPDRSKWVKYRLRDVVVYQSPAGHCFTDLLDDADDTPPEVDETALTTGAQRYIRDWLSSNRDRLNAHVALAQQYVELEEASVLDVGCGSGVFLTELEQRGATVEGLELSDSHVLYARRVQGLTVHKRPLSSPFWRERHGTCDLITLWDVLEHLDFPARNVREAAALLKPGGYLMLDTPCRDGVFHRIGDLTYTLSRGRYPTLLNLLYGGYKFGHKQILSMDEIRELLEKAGLEVIQLDPLHELALPIESYLVKLLHSQPASKALAGPVRRLMQTTRPWNKVRAVARKKA